MWILARPQQEIRDIMEDMFITRASQYILLLLRMAMGWIFVYEGFQMFRSDTWSITSLLSGSHIAPNFYNYLLSEPALSILNQAFPIVCIVGGGLVLLGLWMRIGIGLLVVVNLLVYIPLLRGLSVLPSSYIVDYHIVYIFILLMLALVGADRFWGLGAEVRINK